ncbi:outer membrane protein assembly factor BamA, partial [Candidatus Pelagibacter sp.]|nr:outer membrane protein assembly factor BamA [Candidatus Pelagibacter sp.]
MLKYFLQIFVIFFFLTLSIKSEEYNNVLIKGNERISNETILVFSELPNVKILDENSMNTILKKLYQSGFFKNVVIKIEKKNLIIDVIENPIIQTVFIEGIKRKKTVNSLYDILLLKNRSAFNLNSIKVDEQNILNFLRDDGYYFSKISTSYNDLKNNKIDLF